MKRSRKLELVDGLIKNTKNLEAAIEQLKDVECDETDRQLITGVEELLPDLRELIRELQKEDIL